MLIVTDEVAAECVTHELAYRSVADAFRDVSSGQASINPVVIGAGCRHGESYTIKSGVSLDKQIVGLKVGSYWPGNAAAGIPAHSSSILLLDPRTGRPHALVMAARLNGFRTAAADAVAVDALARDDAETLSIIGAGHQARFEVEAIRRVRRIRQILIASRRPEVAAEWVGQLRSDGVMAQAVCVEEACRRADILVTATISTRPLFASEWIRKGTHISSMGSDQAGKQELPPQLLGTAALFADLPSQSARIGEFQHVANVCGPGKTLVAIGDVLRGVHPGRRDREAITIFDSSGLALQDLYVAAEVLTQAQQRRKALVVVETLEER